MTVYTGVDVIFRSESSVYLLRNATFSASGASVTVYDADDSEICGLFFGVGWDFTLGDWERDGTVLVQGLFSVVDTIYRDVSMVLDYADNRFHGFLTDVARDDTENFRVEGNGHYSMGFSNW